MCCRAAPLTDELKTIRDFIRYATSRFNAARVAYGQGFESALDEASYLVLASLHLPPDLPPAYAGARLLADERHLLLERIEARVRDRVPVAYLTGEAWFAGMSFRVSRDVLIPRSPFAELIEKGLMPWLGERDPQRALDLCTGSGCIGIALAAHFPGLAVDLVDVSESALAIARQNIADHGLDERVRARHSDAFAALAGEQYDLILSNPPYVGQEEYAALPAEFSHEPALALISGQDGLDLPLRILADAPAHLSEDGLLFLEVGASEAALMEALPELPALWIDFERGGSGVLCIDREALLGAADAVQEQLRRRGLRA